MTTIAFDGKTMACDTRVSGSHNYHTDTKIYENELFVIGVSGDAGVGTLLIDYPYILQPRYYDFDFSALVWVKEAKQLYDVAFFKSWDVPMSAVVPVSDGFAAVGSGAPYAMATMYLGHTAARAITVASQFDANTGGKIITKQLLG